MIWNFRRWQEWMGSGGLQPSWNVYIHDKSEVIPAYVVVNQLSPIRLEHSTQTMIGFDTDRYTFISKKDDECIDVPGYSVQRVRIDKQILEDNFTFRTCPTSLKMIFLMLTKISFLLIVFQRRILENLQRGSSARRIFFWDLQGSLK